MIQTSDPSYETWDLFCELAPVSLISQNKLRQISACLRAPGLRDQLCAHERAGRYPAEILQEIQRHGVAAFYSDDPRAGPVAAPSPHTILDATGLNFGLSVESGSVAVSIAINYLASFPVWIAGTASQIAAHNQLLRSGSFAAIGLTERSAGSDLARISTCARPAGTGGRYTLSGTKDLINGGRYHQALTVLARTGGPGAGGLSMFLVNRHAAVTGSKRWYTDPVPAADISSVQFENAQGQLLGRAGRGFDITQRALAISRGGVAALSFGCSANAFSLSLAHARSRKPGGTPIIDHAPIADHLLTVRSSELIAGSMTFRAAALINAYGPAATMSAAIAKLMVGRLSERAVSHAALVLSAAGLLTDSEFYRLSRDHRVYGIFDGTSHIVLSHIRLRLGQMMSRDPSGNVTNSIRQAYRTEATSLVTVAGLRSSLLDTHPASHAQWLAERTGADFAAEIACLAQSLQRRIFTSIHDRSWQLHPRSALELADLFAGMEAILATVELTQRAAREALGVTESPNAGALEVLGRYAACELAQKVALRLAETEPDHAPLLKRVMYFSAQIRDLRTQILTDRMFDPW